MTGDIDPWLPESADKPLWCVYDTNRGHPYFAASCMIMMAVAMCGDTASTANPQGSGR